MTGQLKICLGSILLFLCACAGQEPAADPPNAAAFAGSTFVVLDPQALCEFGLEDALANLRAKMEYTAKEQGVKSFEYHRLDGIIMWRGERDNSDDYFIQAAYEGFWISRHDKPGSHAMCAERATSVFFHLINFPLRKNDVKFYALKSGDKILGGYLSTEEVQKIKSANPDNNAAWPYMPMCYTNLPDHINQFNLQDFRLRPLSKHQLCESLM